LRRSRPSPDHFCSNSEARIMAAGKTAHAQRGVANALFASVSALFVAVMFPSLNNSMWRDEAASLYSAHLSWTQLWRESLVVDRVLLTYYALLHVWLNLSYSIEWARVLSLLAYGLTAYFVGVLTNRVAGLWCGLLAVALTCTNPLMISSALDARPYALATLVSVVSVVAFLRWFDRGELRFLWIFSLLAIAVVMLQFFMVLAPLSVLGACAVLKPQLFRREWRKMLPPVALLAAAGVTFLALVARQQGQVAWISGLTPKLLGEDLEGPASSTAGHLIYPALVAVLAILSVAVCILGWRRHSLRLSRFEVDRIVIFISWAAVPTVLLVLVTAVKPVYVDRYITASVPGMAIALALLLTYAMRAIGTPTSLPKRTFVGGAVIAGLAVLIANSVAIASSTSEDLRGAAQYIARSASRTSEVAVPGHFLTTGVEYYLDRVNSTLRLWPQMSGQRFNDGLVLREGEGTFATAPNNVWLVDDGSIKGTNGFIASLKRHGYMRVTGKSFHGSADVTVIHFFRQNDG